MQISPVMDPQEETSLSVTHFGQGELLNSTSQPCRMTIYKPQSLEVTHATILVILTTFCVSTNITVLVVIFKTPKLQTVTNAFICNLALSDLLNGLLFFLYNITHMEFSRSVLGIVQTLCQQKLAGK